MVENNIDEGEFLKIYSGLFEAKRPSLELPIMTLDMSIMSKQKTINGIATIVHDRDSKNIVKSKFRSANNNARRMNDGSVLINCTGFPVERNVTLPCFKEDLDPYDREVLEMNYSLPNLKMLLRIDASWSSGVVSYKFRTHCFKDWISMDAVPIDLNQDGLQKVA